MRGGIARHQGFEGPFAEAGFEFHFAAGGEGTATNEIGGGIEGGRQGGDDADAGTGGYGLIRHGLVDPQHRYA